MSELPKCCICLDEFTRPVSLPCGHCFCLGCIGEYWRLNVTCQCPFCRALFPTRPPLKTDKTQHACAQTEAATVPLRAGEVPCDLCPAKHRAVKSCLVCLASYCDAHLEPHYQDAALGRHRLVSVWKNVEEDAVCGLHGKRIDRFCRSDQTCICTVCAQTDHRCHRVVSVTKEAARKKVKLNRRRIKLQQMIQERLEKVENMKLGENKNETWTGAEGLVKELEEEIAELQRRIGELEQLSHTEDGLHFLQRFLHAASS